METFLHPRQTGGVLIQLAQAPVDLPPPLELSVEDFLAQAGELRRDARVSRTIGYRRVPRPVNGAPLRSRRVVAIYI
jgi:hypothetical protein